MRQTRLADCAGGVLTTSTSAILSRRWNQSSESIVQTRCGVLQYTALLSTEQRRLTGVSNAVSVAGQWTEPVVLRCRQSHTEICIAASGLNN